MKKFSLDQHPKIAAGFKTPDDYFDTLPDRVMQRLENDPPVIQLNRRSSWIWAAASVIALALALPILNKISQPSPSQLDTVAIENYLLTQSGFSSEELAEGLGYEQPGELRYIGLDPILIEEALENQDIEHYLTH